jgi:voltage-gated potassium channel
MKYITPWKKSIFNYIIISIGVVIIYVEIFIHLMKIEQPIHANHLTAIYWVSSTMTTVGFGDVVFTTNIGKIFSIIVQLSGVVIVFGILLTFVISPWFEKLAKESLPLKVPNDLKDHVIVCGHNHIVESLIDEFKKNNTKFIIIERDSQIVKDFLKMKIPCIFGISSDIDTLRNANIGSAKLLIANKSDYENANIILTSKEICEIHTIATVEHSKNIKHLTLAGATWAVSPKSLFGQYIGKKAIDSKITRLTGAIEFFKGTYIVDFPIYPKSKLVGVSVKDAHIEQITNAKIVGIWKEGVLSFDDDPNYIFNTSSMILAVGTTEELFKLKNMTK